VDVGDFNNDNRLDIVVANFGTNNIGIFLGNGNGTFENQTTFSTGSGSAPVAVVVGDLNNNNCLDIVVANFYGQNVGIFFGYNNGTFASQITLSTGELSYPAFVTLSDLNNDFLLDILAPRIDRDSLSIFLGIGNGSFLSEVPFYTGYQSAPAYVAVGDLNNDSFLDIVVGNSNVNFISIFPGSGVGAFGSLIVHRIASDATQNFVAIADLNGDKQLDVILANYDGNFIAALFGYDALDFGSPMEFPTSYAVLSSSVSIGDFNRDNRLDIAVSDFGTSDIDIYFRDENGTFLIKRSLSTGENSYPQMVASADLNNDNILDIAVVNTGTDDLGVFLGYGNGSFQSIMTYSTGSQSQPYSLAIGDFNNDNRSDFAVANYGADNVGILLGFDIGNFTAIPNLILYSTSVSLSLKYLATGDFNKDNLPDIVFVDKNTDMVVIFLTQGNGTFSNPITYSTGSGSVPSSVVVGDFNDDTNLDIAVANNGSKSISIFLGDDHGAFGAPTMFSTGGFLLSFVTVGDFNNDSHLDVVVAISDADQIGIFFGDGNGKLTSIATYSTGLGSALSSLAVGDFNHDNHSDIVVTNSGTNQIGILLGNGNGSFASQIVYSNAPGSNPVSVALGDFNNDNQLDIVVASFANGIIGIYLGHKNGTFTGPGTFYIGSAAQPASVAVGDFNNDNNLDIVVACIY
jgi:hypothetical protein